MKKQQGEQCEQLARKYLEKHGLEFVINNFRVKCGEIDLIMRDPTSIVFVEVRFRKNNLFGGPLESIDWFKQQRIISAADLFLQKYTWAQHFPSRFDVVSLSGDIQAPKIEWIKDAFQIT
jgi:putative endonuclease